MSVPGRPAFPVGAEPGYTQTTAALNPISDLLRDVFGAAGHHARTAIGVTALPLNLPVIVAAEVLLSPSIDSEWPSYPRRRGESLPKLSRR